MKRTLGCSGIEVSALGMGCWAIGGPFWLDGKPVGWGRVDDDESVQAVHKALDLGITFFDTADVYGCGHSETILGKALGHRREDVIIATKFGRVFDEEKKCILGSKADPDHIRSACGNSLRRLGTDRIDLYQFHLGDYDPGQAAEVRDVLEELVSAGKIRYYGWSTDDPERARVFAAGDHCAAIQQAFNVFGGNDETLRLCEELNLASINRGPLAMGILTGKFSEDTTLPDDDLRSRFDFKRGVQADQLRSLDSIRKILTSEGRTLAQGALAWLWARSGNTIPIPGFKTVQQVSENAGAMRYGPLKADRMAEIDRFLGRSAASSS